MITDHFHQHFVHTRRIDVLCRQLTGLLPPKVHVLDIGCGDGRLDRALLERRADLVISGADVLVREETAIPVTPFDGSTLPFDTGSFDVSLLIDVLHHTQQIPRLLAEAARVSRRYVLIKDHLADGCLSRPLLAFMDRVGNRRHGVALPENYLKRIEWEQIYQDLRLREIVHEGRLRLYPWWADWLFGRSLHFLSLLEVADGSAAAAPGSR